MPETIKDAAPTSLAAVWQSGVRFRAFPTGALLEQLPRWIGCQRVVYSNKVAEDKLFASLRRLELNSDESACVFAAPMFTGCVVGAGLPRGHGGGAQCASNTEVSTPLDQAYSQFKSELTPWLAEVPSQILRNGAVRFFAAKQRQLKGLAKAPRYRNAVNFDSVHITSELFRFKDVIDPRTGEIQQKLEIGTASKPLGFLAFNAHCAHGMPSSITVRRTGRHWWLSFSYEHAAPEGFVERTAEELAYELNNLSEPELRLTTLGVDRNVKDNCIATSDGRFFRLSAIQETRLARKALGAQRYQRKMARQKKGSNNRAKSVKRIGAKLGYGACVRQDFSHQTSHQLVRMPANEDRAPRLIGFEALKIKNMVAKPKAKVDPETGKFLPNGASAKAGLSRKILGACWGAIHQQVKYKAQRAGALVLELPPYYSSQKCSRCGHTHPDNRSDERFICQRCKHHAHADSNAGRNMAASAIERVRLEQVVNKVVRRVAFRKKGGKAKSTGAERSRVPVESHKTSLDSAMSAAATLDEAGSPDRKVGNRH